MTTTQNDFKLVDQTLANTTQQLPWNDLVLFNVATLLSEHRGINWTLESLEKVVSRFQKDLSGLMSSPTDCEITFAWCNTCGISIPTDKNSLKNHKC